MEWRWYILQMQRITINFLPCDLIFLLLSGSVVFDSLPLTPWTTACLASLSFIKSQSSIKQVYDLMVPLYLKSCSWVCSREWYGKLFLYIYFMLLSIFLDLIISLSSFPILQLLLLTNSNRNSNRNLLFLLTVGQKQYSFYFQRNKNTLWCVYTWKWKRKGHAWNFLSGI